MHLYARLTLFIGYSLRLYCGGKLVLDPSRMITCIVPSITFSLIFTKPLCECQYWITKTLCLICVEPSLAGCIILVVLIWCRRRWRNNVPIWGRHWNTNLLYLSFLCYSKYSCRVLVPTPLFWLQNDMRIKGYDYRQCVGLKIKPRRGDGLLFYSLFLNGTIDQVIFMLENQI